jgi:membrane associated rhomboid family serine protease
MIGILVFFSLLFSFGSDIDTYGHLGGMLGGLLITLSIAPAIQTKNKIFTIIGSAAYTGYILLTIILFYFVI